MVLADGDNEKEDISYALRNHGWMLKGIESHKESYRISISAFPKTNKAPLSGLTFSILKISAIFGHRIARYCSLRWN